VAQTAAKLVPEPIWDAEPKELAIEFPFSKMFAEIDEAA
jgi:hypothetical protein